MQPLSRITGPGCRLSLVRLMRFEQLVKLARPFRVDVFSGGGDLGTTELL